MTKKDFEFLANSFAKLPVENRIQMADELEKNYPNFQKLRWLAWANREGQK